MSRLRMGSMSLALAFLAVATGALAADLAADEGSCAIMGFGVVKYDDQRWACATRTVNQIVATTFTRKDNGKRVLFIYRTDRDLNIDDAIVGIQRVVRGVNDLAITNAPKYKDLYLAAGVLANYETMTVENVGFSINVSRVPITPGTVSISTADNPLEDKDLSEIAKQLEAMQKGPANR
jgi:hypothetical protein